MNLVVVVVVLAGAAVFAVVGVWRTVSCRRFQRALASFATTDAPDRTTKTVGIDATSRVVDARHRFEARAHDALVAERPRSA